MTDQAPQTPHAELYQKLLDLTSPEAKMQTIRLIAPILAGILHLAQIIIFCAMGYPALGVMSVFSVLLFIAIIFMVKGGYSRLGMYLIYLEVVVHSTILTLAMGLESGYLLYHFSLIAGGFVVFSANEQRDRFIVLSLSVIVAPLVMLITTRFDPYYAVPASQMYFFFFMNLIGTLFSLVGIVWYFASVSSRYEKLIAHEQERAESLLLNVLPEPIARRLKQESQTIVDHYPSVSVLFADIVGFTQLASRLQVGELIDMLNNIFSSFDTLADHHGLEKIKTIGDAYMVAGGIPQPLENHVGAMAEMALAMRKAVQNYAREQEIDLDIRIGIHAGEVVAGVIGLRKFTYDLWGDTVNLASRMESHSQPGKIQISQTVYQILQNSYIMEERGEIEIKGKGKIPAWFLEHKSETETKENE